MFNPQLVGGDWNMTRLFFHILGIIIIFFRRVETTNQPKMTSHFRIPTSPSCREFNERKICRNPRRASNPPSRFPSFLVTSPCFSNLFSEGHWLNRHFSPCLLAKSLCVPAKTSKSSMGSLILCHKWRIIIHYWQHITIFCEVRLTMTMNN